MGEKDCSFHTNQFQSSFRMVKGVKSQVLRSKKPARAVSEPPEIKIDSSASSASTSAASTSAASTSASTSTKPASAAGPSSSSADPLLEDEDDLPAPFDEEEETAVR